MKSDILIKDDIFAILRDSPLAKAVSGKLCKQGVRPKGSDKEDIVISVLANENGQLQEAFVNVNIYVNDDIKGNGQNQEATIRLRELCSLSAQVLECGSGGDFRFTLESQRVLPVEEAKLHVINNKLNYKQLNE